MWLKKVCSIEPDHFSRLQDMVAKAYPFFVFIVNDQLVAKHRRHIELVRVSTK